MWIRFFNRGSLTDKGTLYQLKNIINRTSVPNDPADNMKAAEDFMLLVLHAHIIAACKELLGKNDIQSVSQLAEKVIECYVRLEGNSDEDDQVLVYASDLLTLGLLWWGYHDAVREGDGTRIQNYWVFLLPVFIMSGRKNYSIEALNIQLQQKYLSERQAAQLVWSRCINTQGRQGCNIPCDLHIEHFNRRLKGAIRNLGSNVQPASIVRAAKSIGVVHHVCGEFENQTSNSTVSSKHSDPGFGEDYKYISSVLEEAKVFSCSPGRRHPAFKMSKGLLQSFDKKKYLKWVQRHIKS